jgi:hypothetical protein
MAERKIVRVEAVKNENGDFVLKLTPDTPLVLEVSGDGTDDDEPVWQCLNGHLEIRFDPRGVSDESDPFGDPMGRYEKPTSLNIEPGPPVREALDDKAAEERSYKYHLIVTTDDGRVASLDPDVVVRRRRPVR